MSRKVHKFQTVAEYQSLVSDGGDTYGLNETLCLNYIPSGGIDCTNTISFYNRFGVKVKEYVQSLKPTGTFTTFTLLNLAHSSQDLALAVVFIINLG